VEQLAAPAMMAGTVAMVAVPQAPEVSGSPATSRAVVAAADGQDPIRTEAVAMAAPDK